MPKRSLIKPNKPCFTLLIFEMFTNPCSAGFSFTRALGQAEIQGPYSVKFGMARSPWACSRAPMRSKGNAPGGGLEAKHMEAV